MPVHVVAGHLVVVAAPLAAVLALGLVVRAGDAGGKLLERVERTGSSAEVAAGLLAVAAAAVLVTTWTTTAQALDAVWDHHPSWTGAS